MTSLPNRSRRSVVGGLLAAAVVPGTVFAHTPYKQWAVYRQKHLLIGCHKDLPETYQLAQSIVATLDENLPAASARIARAPAPTRLASLLATRQLDVAVLTPDTAVKIHDGEGIYAAYGSIALTTLLPLDGYLVVGHTRLKESHCWQITRALESITTVDARSITPALPWHSGTARFLEGSPLPHTE